MTPATDNAVAEVRCYLGMPESELPTSAILEVLELCQWNVKQAVGLLWLDRSGRAHYPRTTAADNLKGLI